MEGQPVKLTDASIKRAAFAKDKPYRIVDSDLPGFYLHVGQDWKTLRMRLEVDGNTRGFSWAWCKPGSQGGPTFSADEARTAAEDIRKRRDRRESLSGPGEGITLRQAWESYLGLLNKKQRSERTIQDYTDKVERCLAALLDKPLREITRAHASGLHAEITDAGHPYMANGVMRVGHAIYSHAAKDLEMPLPPLNPFRGRNLFNKETPRPGKLKEADLPAWFAQLCAMPSPVWREWFWLALLTGLRRETVKVIRLEDIHRDYIEIPAPKGGLERTFKVPMSDAIRRSVARAKRAGEPLRSIPRCAQWLFPSPSAKKKGHVSHPANQDIDSTPHDLRKAFILCATGAGVIKTHRQVLTNHRVAKDVHEEYMHVAAMFDQLVEAQAKVSARILQHMGKGAEAKLEALLKRDLAPKDEAKAA